MAPYKNGVITKNDGESRYFQWTTNQRCDLFFDRDGSLAKRIAWSPQEKERWLRSIKHQPLE